MLWIQVEIVKEVGSHRKDLDLRLQKMYKGVVRIVEI